MGKTRFVVVGSLVNGHGDGMRRNVFLVLKDGLITAIGPAADLPGRDADAIDDLAHCTILPALVDCSVSLAKSPSVDRQVRISLEEASIATRAAMLERHIHDCHAHGVLGVVDGDDISDLAGRNQEGVTSGSSIAIRTSGGLCQCGGGGLATGDFVKIGYSRSIEDQGATSPLDYGDLSRILQSKGEKKAVVVANGQRQVGEALEAGCEAIEQGYGMGEDNLVKMKERGVMWIPSVLRAKNALDGASTSGDVCCRFSNRYVAPGKALPGAELFWKKVLAEQLMQLRFARRLGVTTALGTGAGSVGILHGESMVEEMKLFIKAGYSLEETIRCASENGARFFGMGSLGALTVGRKATFLVTRGTPQQLPRKLSYLEGIYVDGVPSITYRKNPVRVG